VTVVAAIQGPGRPHFAASVPPGLRFWA